MGFKKIQLSELSVNPFDLIGKDWMLLTGGNSESFNTMTASWGQMGILWGKPVMTCYIRTNRYTYEFVEKGDCLTASFFDEQYRDVLKFCGANSGRDCDKVSETGITPTELDGCVGFKEAKMVLVCKKLYTYDMCSEGFVPSAKGFDQQFYSSDPYHKAYICEITGAYIKE